MSAIIREAMERWQAMRSEYELHRRAAFERADADLHGELLNRRGQSEGVDAESLFMGTWARARAYASEDLIRWWEDGNPRVTVEMFERDWLAAEVEPTMEEETRWT